MIFTPFENATIAEVKSFFLKRALPSSFILSNSFMSIWVKRSLLKSCFYVQSGLVCLKISSFLSLFLFACLAFTDMQWLIELIVIIWLFCEHIERVGLLLWSQQSDSLKVN